MNASSTVYKFTVMVYCREITKHCPKFKRLWTFFLLHTIAMSVQHEYNNIMRTS